MSKPSPSPTPYADDTQPAAEGQPVKAGDYTIISSVEVGARGQGVDGNRNEYRSDLNYDAGFRLFESSFLMRAAEGKGTLFDSLLINSSGWGADPHGSLRINAEKGRWYRNDTTFNSGFNRGNNTTNTSVLTSLQRDQPMHGRAAFTRLSATTTIARKLDVTARYTYTRARTHFLDVETSAGTNSPGNPFNPDLINFTGETERPAHLAEAGLTWRTTKHLRLQYTFRFNKFSNEGDEVFSELVFTTRPNGTPVQPFPAVTSVPVSRLPEYRRFANQIKLDYQFGPRLSFHAGYRNTDRRIETQGVGRLLPAPVSATATEEERIDTSNNSFFDGFRARPAKDWTIYFDAEKGRPTTPSRVLTTSTRSVSAAEPAGRRAAASPSTSTSRRATTTTPA